MTYFYRHRIFLLPVSLAICCARLSIFAAPALALPQSTPKVPVPLSAPPPPVVAPVMKWEGNNFTVTGSFTFTGVRGLETPQESYMVEAGRDGTIILRADAFSPRSGPLLHVDKKRVSAHFYRPGESQPRKAILREWNGGMTILPPVTAMNGGKFIITIAPPAN